MKSSPRSGGIDHLVLACRDLAAATDGYRRLGFQVGARNRHPWGTENHIIQLQGAFLELIGLGEPADSGEKAGRFAGFLEDFLAKREGLAMLVLESDDAVADHARFAAQGIGDGGAPFYFERRGKRPDGTDVTVAFTLAFARSAQVGEAGFFGCQQHHPENFWNAAFKVHPNSARAVLGVVMVAEDPAAHASFLSCFAEDGEPRTSTRGVEIDTGRGRIDVLTPAAFAGRFGEPGAADASPRLAAYRVGVGDLRILAEALATGELAFERRGDSIIVPPAQAFGCTLIFEAMAPTPSGDGDASLV